MQHQNDCNCRACTDEAITHAIRDCDAKPCECVSVADQLGTNKDGYRVMRCAECGTVYSERWYGYPD